jgi:hypothetical protein
MREGARSVANIKLAVLLGAGFSKPWGLPLTAELMRFDEVKRHRFPGAWQKKNIAQIESQWLERTQEHQGSVDEFGRLLHGTPLFVPFVRYIALRLSSPLWHVGGAQQTKWGTGDHVARKSRLPAAYVELIHVLQQTELVGIVTMNYDIVVEKLLGPRSRGRLGGFNYGRPGETLVGRHYTSSQGAYGPIELTGAIPLAKVHGSLNWAFSEDEHLIRYVDCRPSRGRRYRVAVFPPGGADAQPFRQVFHLAERILSAATVWLVIGYSLPDGDEDVRQLIRRSTSRLGRLCIADPRSRDLVERFARVVGESKVRIEELPGLGSDALSTILGESLTGTQSTA